MPYLWHRSACLKFFYQYEVPAAQVISINNRRAAFFRWGASHALHSGIVHEGYCAIEFTPQSD